MNSRTRRLLASSVTAVLLIGTAACGAPAPAPTTAPAAAPTVRLTVAPAGTITAPPAPVPAPGSGPASAAERDDDGVVEKLAVEWLVAYRAADYTDPAGAWIDRTARYVTPELAQQNHRLRVGGRGPGIAWQDFTDRRCTAGVLDPAAMIPPEAPRTDTTVRVQAAGTLRTSCRAGSDPPDEALAVTLTAVRTTAGWRIASRDY